MMKNIDLSIIVPIYNVEDYLEECLNSVYPLSISKEIILVNDGSTDNSLKIAEKYKNLYPNETILISQENKGQSAARNIGLKNANGEYIYFLDSDDFVDTQKFEEFFNEIVDTDIDIIHGNALKYYSNKKNNELFKQKVNLKNNIMNGKEFILSLYEKNSYTEAPCFNIYKKDFLQKNNFYFTEKILYEDTLLSFIAFSKAMKIKYSPITFYNYRQNRNGSIMSKPRNYMHTLFIIDKLLDYSQKEDISSYELSDYFVSQIKSFSKRQKIFNREIFEKLLKLKYKNFKIRRKLIETYIRSFFCKKINHDDILNILK